MKQISCHQNRLVIMGMRWLSWEKVGNHRSGLVMGVDPWRTGCVQLTLFLCMPLTCPLPCYDVTQRPSSTRLPWILSVQPSGCELSLFLPCMVARMWGSSSSSNSIQPTPIPASSCLQVLFESFGTDEHSGAGFWHYVTFSWCIPVLMFSFEGYQSYCVNSYIFQPGLCSLNYIYKCPFSKWVHRHMCRVFLQCTTGLSGWALRHVLWAGRVCEGSTFKLCTWGVTVHGGHNWKSQTIQCSLTGTMWRCLDFIQRGNWGRQLSLRTHGSIWCLVTGPPWYSRHVQPVAYRPQAYQAIDVTQQNIANLFNIL